MKSNPFHFKQFLIHHDRCVMKVGTDGVLLGAWAHLDNARTVLDIGTGSGLIAIMAAQRSSDSFIEGVEIDEASYLQAKENARLSKWSNRIKITNTGIQNFFPETKYDTILSNPPYFKNDTELKNPAREKARNSNNLTPKDLILSVDRLMASLGSFFLIYPFEEGKKIIKLAEKHGLFVAKSMVVYSRAGMAPERLLIEFTRSKSQFINHELIIYKSAKDSKRYTNEYISITKDFYLYM